MKEISGNGNISSRLGISADQSVQCSHILEFGLVISLDLVYLVCCTVNGTYHHVKPIY